MPEGHLTELPGTNHSEDPVVEDICDQPECSIRSYVRNRDRGDDWSEVEYSARKATTPPGVDPNKKVLQITTWTGL